MGFRWTRGWRRWLARKAAGESFDVKAKCAGLGVSRKTFYKYLRCFTEEGIAGLFPRSRRPLSNPRAVDLGVADAVIASIITSAVPSEVTLSTSLLATSLCRATWTATSPPLARVALIPARSGATHTRADR